MSWANLTAADGFGVSFGSWPSASSSTSRKLGPLGSPFVMAGSCHGSARTQVAHGRVALEQVEEGPQRLAARALEVGVTFEGESRIVAGRRQELTMDRQIGQPELR